MKQYRRHFVNHPPSLPLLPSVMITTSDGTPTVFCGTILVFSQYPYHYNDIIFWILKLPMVHSLIKKPLDLRQWRWNEHPRSNNTKDTGLGLRKFHKNLLSKSGAHARIKHVWYAAVHTIKTSPIKQDKKNCFEFLIDCLMAFKFYQTWPIGLHTIKHDPNTIKQHQTRWPNGSFSVHRWSAQALQPSWNT